MATTYATNCDDVERMILWKEPVSTPPPAPPPQAATPPQSGPTEPDIFVSDANTGQLGHEGRLRLTAIIADAKAKDLFPANPKIVDALPGRGVPIPLVDEDVTPVAFKQQQYNLIQADIVIQ